MARPSEAFAGRRIGVTETFSRCVPNVEHMNYVINDRENDPV